MSRAFLTKRDVNERFYGTVDPEAAFVTEVQVGFHQVAVGRLVARHAAGLGRRRLRILELGASTCLFALAFLQVLGELVGLGEASLDMVDYTAVDYSLGALEVALGTAPRDFRPGATRGKPLLGANGAPIVELAHLSSDGDPALSLALVQADANAFVDATDERFDVVIANELLDDLPCRVLYADERGDRYELSAVAREEGPVWHVAVTATGPGAGGPAGQPPGTVAATSEESCRLVAAAEGVLESGGLMLVHDYGFSERFADAAQYADPQPVLPAFVELELPEAPGAPRSFFRVFGDEAAHSIQITNDVGFAELAELLEPGGPVITLPHGNMLTTVREWPDLFFKGDGVFVSEFINLTADDDLPALLAELHDRQGELRERYVNTFGSGRTAIITDLIHVKA